MFPVRRGGEKRGRVSQERPTIWIGIGIPPGSTAETHDGRVATGDAAAALVLASEVRAMRAALEALVGWT